MTVRSLLAGAPPETPERRLRAAGLWHVVEYVAARHAVTIEELLGEQRTTRIADARRDLYVVLAHTIALSYKEIGRLLGRCHSTVMAAMHAHEERMAREAGVPPPPRRYQRGIPNGHLGSVSPARRSA